MAAGAVRQLTTSIVVAGQAFYFSWEATEFVDNAFKRFLDGIPACPACEHFASLTRQAVRQVMGMLCMWTCPELRRGAFASL